MVRDTIGIRSKSDSPQRTQRAQRKPSAQRRGIRRSMVRTHPFANEREGWGTLEFIRGTVLEHKRKAHASEGGRYKGVRADG